jgi:hypothetical protein
MKHVFKTYNQARGNIWTYQESRITQVREYEKGGPAGVDRVLSVGGRENVQGKRLGSQ